MARLRIAILAALVFLAAQPAEAARFSGDYLLQMCASDKNGKELVPGGHVACQSYIAGVIDYHNLIRSLGTAPSVEFCLPESVGLNEVQDKVAAYIYKNKQEHGAFVASPAVALALYNSYPCGKKK
jgi:Rap1a immunity proteins